jgi:hypothetical protein
MKDKIVKKLFQKLFFFFGHNLNLHFCIQTHRVDFAAIPKIKMEILFAAKINLESS